MISHDPPALDGVDLVRKLPRGEGIRRLAATEDRMGLGLGVMSALADRVEFRHPRGGGREPTSASRLASDRPFTCTETLPRRSTSSMAP